MRNAEAMLDPRAHVVHVVHRLGIGGMENGVVNLVNRLPVERYRPKRRNAREGAPPCSKLNTLITYARGTRFSPW